MSISPETLRLLMVIPTGFLLDLCFGDPYWLPHPVRLMGWLIEKGESLVRRRFSKGENFPSEENFPGGENFPSRKKGELAGGLILVLLVGLPCFFVPLFLLILARTFSPWAAFVLESFMCYQILATRSLSKESGKVFRRLLEKDLPGARKAVSMIVGRDTAELDFPQVTKAAVETVAENTCDGVIAPLFYLALGGAPLGFLYKAVNTMDSMIGYRNERYLYLGRTAARLDDGANFIPARLSAGMLIAAAGLIGLDPKGAWRIYRRDRKNHASPNSAHTEAVAAGALGIELAGDAYYGGVLHKKQTIGDPLRPVEPEDIPRTNRLMYAAATLSLVALSLLRAALLFIAS